MSCINVIGITSTTSYIEKYICVIEKSIKVVRTAKRKGWLYYCERTQDVYDSVFKFISRKKGSYTDFIFETLESSKVYNSFGDVTRSLMSEHFDIDDIPAKIFKLVFSSSSADDVGFRGVTIIMCGTCFFCKHRR